MPGHLQRLNLDDLRKARSGRGSASLVTVLVEVMSSLLQNPSSNLDVLSFLTLFEFVDDKQERREAALAEQCQTNQIACMGLLRCDCVMNNNRNFIVTDS
jgi:hypothetical protein